MSGFNVKTGLASKAHSPSNPKSRSLYLGRYPNPPAPKRIHMELTFSAPLMDLDHNFK